MATLRAALAAATWTAITDSNAEIGTLWKVDNESIRVMGTYQPVTPPGSLPATDWYWVVQRGRGGTAVAAHSNGATLTTFDPESGTTSGGGPHTHPESDVTSLVTDLAGKAPTHTHPYSATVHGHAIADTTSLQATLDAKATGSHNHDASYAPTHSHPYEPSGAVATHAGLADPHPGYLTPAEGNAAYAPTHSHPYAATSHSHVDADIPAAIARDAEVTSAISTHAATPHGGSLPAGLIVMWGGLLANIPAGWLLCDGQNGTPDLRDRFVKGAAAAANPGATGGAATHGHTVTQPADHAALTHTGTAVGNHTFTQPTAAAEAAHTHTYTQTVNHVHVEQLQGGTTGTTTGTHLMGSAATGGSLRSSAQSTVNPTGGVASGTTAAGTSHTHTISGGAVDAHAVTQPSQHAAQSHSGAAVNTVNSEPAYFALCFIQKT